MQLPDNEWVISKFVSVKIESNNFISSPGPTKGPGELLPSLGVRRLLSVVCRL
jgi:hypothetical protein